LTFSLGSTQPAFEARLRKLDADRFAERLWAHDDSLWGDDPERRRVAANRLGWLDVPSSMRNEVDALHTLAISIWREGFTHAVLLGMGGSSLAPEVLRQTFGIKPGAIELDVLDNTSPAAVRAIADGHDPKTTLFLVSSKSGSTLEVTSFEKFFYEWVAAARGAQAGRAFVAITDPNTSLEKLAVERGYRRVCSNPPDIGGRYSALSYFGLVPASLIGVDTGDLLDAAVAESQVSGAKVTIKSGSIVWPPITSIQSGQVRHSTLNIAIAVAGHSLSEKVHVTVRGAGTQSVTVPAGTYRATVVDETMAEKVMGFPVRITVRTWLASGVGPVKTEVLSKAAAASGVNVTEELRSFTR